MAHNLDTERDSPVLSLNHNPTLAGHCRLMPVTRSLARANNGIAVRGVGAICWPVDETAPCEVAVAARLSPEGDRCSWRVHW